MTAHVPPLVGICTKDRPTELRRCLAALGRQGVPLHVHVVDASADDAAERACASALPDGVTLSWVRAAPGLAAQRNKVLEYASASGAELVICVDDDVVAEPGFVRGLLDMAAEEPDVAAFGAVVVDEPHVRFVRLKSVFLLWSTTPGRVLRSGRNVIGHAPAGPWPRRVEWLSTCAVALRTSSTAGLHFDESLPGYSLGEDLDFTFRLGRRHTLAICPGAAVRHLPSASGRPLPRAMARQRILFLHGFVRRNQDAGLSPVCFWWSVLGELLLAMTGALVGHPAARATARGVLDGSAALLRAALRSRLADRRAR